MRLHHLSVQAFGPFAEPAHVDFDQLNEAGLFLLTGDTGAGKSSLLDAVCFAVYGTVPGARGVKTLKSHHAAADAAPQVELDFTVQGRRFVVRRRPEWARPKRRGTGTAVEKASASLFEVVDGEQRLVSARAAEVGHLLTSLMGMNSGQFLQVALLPQGEFQTFLQASSQDRHAVLQHLFGTRRFAAIEDWVHEHARTLAEAALDGEREVQRLLDTLAHRCGVEVPDDLGQDALAQSAAAGSALSWARERSGVADRAARTTEEDHRQAQTAVEVLTERVATAERRWESAHRRAQARSALLALEDSAEAARQAQRRLDDHERAGVCAPLVELRRQAMQERESARDRARTAGVGELMTSELSGGERLTSELPDDQMLNDQFESAARPSEPASQGSLGAPAGLERALGLARRRAARLEALLPRERAGLDAAARRAKLVARLDEVEVELERVRDRSARLPEELSAATRALAEVEQTAARCEALRLSVASARRRRAAAEELVQVLALVASAEDRRRAGRDAAQDARQIVQDLQARRLAEMAAELAGGLHDEAECPVCGSTEHPRPAAAEPDAVTLVDQERADRDLLTAQRALGDAEAEVVRLRARVDVLVATADGRGVEDAAADLDRLTEDLREAEAAAKARSVLRDAVDVLSREADGLATRATELEVAQAADRQTLVGLDATIGQVLAEIGAVVGSARADGGPSGLGALVGAAYADAEALVERLATARDCAARLEEAARTVDELDARCEDVAVQQGFSGASEAAAAVLDESVRAELARLLRERADARARAELLWESAAADADSFQVDAGAEPGVGTEAGDDAGSVAGLQPGLGGEEGRTVETIGRTLAELRGALAGARTVAAEASAAAAVSAERAEAVADRLRRLEAALQAWAPQRDRSMQAASMSRLVRGMGQDNQLQMRLSAYVLATRLDQVVAAANERLGQMRDQRYVLRRSGRTERRGTQSGLGLEVLDQWTGDVRSPATLSGGETFVVSLTLALGLADVVTHEAGGAEVATLFVDEGFGSLDADTLDDVMDRLDSLRAGGRTVGVVSHVTELRGRIPTQVHVAKDRDGSRVVARTLVG